ncbi:predicted protein [Plenodomus lingam JN3]|uniref:Predicted protein n=1 Tax=Leptosphaeria maculans (strain JN3 / isolate v23.1.3 / race Av1-4-5-6-7-8) TaxID=985895 RepID=E4ZZ09_LEPMJ|nr:predicted protein [Plenodomus lingam JN3]CBX96444.1 predicted protein [Plenodomus lingam JN3]
MPPVRKQPPLECRSVAESRVELQSRRSCLRHKPPGQAKQHDWRLALPVYHTSTTQRHYSHKQASDLAYPQGRWHCSCRPHICIGTEPLSLGGNPEGFPRAVCQAFLAASTVVISLVPYRPSVLCSTVTFYMQSNHCWWRRARPAMYRYRHRNLHSPLAFLPQLTSPCLGLGACAEFHTVGPSACAFADRLALVRLVPAALNCLRPLMLHADLATVPYNRWRTGGLKRLGRLRLDWSQS